MKKKLFIFIALLLYVLFSIETITGYWIWKPREVGNIFMYLMERGTAYSLHVNILPLVLVLVFLIHSSWGLYKFFKNNKIYKITVLLINVFIFLFFVYIHFV